MDKIDRKTKEFAEEVFDRKAVLSKLDELVEGHNEIIKRIKKLEEKDA